MYTIRMYSIHVFFKQTKEVHSSLDITNIYFGIIMKYAYIIFGSELCHRHKFHNFLQVYNSLANNEKYFNIYNASLMSPNDHQPSLIGRIKNNWARVEVKPRKFRHFPQMVRTRCHRWSQI